MVDDPDVVDAVDEQAELARLTAENEALRANLAELAERKVSDRAGWRRPWMSIVCAVVAAILVPLAVLTLWARNTLLDEDQYVATIAPLAEDENVQEAVAFRVTEAVSEGADFRTIAEETLPEEARILAGPIEAGAESLIAEVVGGVLATEVFADLWEESNRAAHENFLPLLKGEESDAIATGDGRVVVKLGSLATQAIERVDERLETDLAAQIPVEELDAELVLVDSEELADAQRLVGWFDTLSWLWVILALGFLAATVYLADRRRLGVRRLGLALVVPIVLTLLGYAWFRSQYLDALPADVHNPDAAAAVFDIMTRFLLRSLRVLLVIGLLVLVGAWVAGPTDSAAKVRTAWDTLLGRASASGDSGEAGALAKAVEPRERGLLTGTAILGALVLVIWPRPTGWVVLLILAVTLLVMAAIRILAEVARRAEVARGTAASSAPAVGGDSDEPAPSDSPSPSTEQDAGDDEPVDSAVS